MTSDAKKEGKVMRCTLKDGFLNLIKYVTYRQEKDEECLKLLVLFFCKHGMGVCKREIMN